MEPDSIARSPDDFDGGLVARSMVSYLQSFRAWQEDVKHFCFMAGAFTHRLDDIGGIANEHYDEGLRAHEMAERLRREFPHYFDEVST